MYGFLVLLPLTIISVLIGAFILLSPQLADYVVFITEVNQPEGKTVWQYFLDNMPYWTRIASHLVAYCIMCFVLIATVRTVSNPLPVDRPAALRFFQLALEAIFVTVPTLVLLWISGRAWWEDTSNPLLALTVGVLCIGFVANVFITARRYPLELYGSSLRPPSVTKPDLMAALSLLIIAGVVVAFAFEPRNSADIVGMFPVLMLASAVAFLAVAAIFSRRTSPVAVLSALITGVLCLHILDWAMPDREFRHTVASPHGNVAAKARPDDVAEIKAQRKLLDLPTAFRAWLEHRKPAIEAYHAQGRAYPIFFVSAQGGGMYAAYHPALSLARLADSCPEFAHHVFGISSVSGGSLGAAVYAETIRTLRQEGPHDPSAARVGCSDVGAPTKINTPIEGHVRRFFETDFLSPVIASAFIFDIPSLIIPQLRFGQDRARALETGFETAWKRLAISRPADGLAANFYERWDPTGLSPALFMATTGVNFGIPILLSQIDYSRIQAMLLTAKKRTTKERVAAPEGEDSELIKSVRERFSQTQETLQVGIGNVLDFRPDLQMTTSTAVVLSARFPFVTPPGLIHENKDIPKGRGLFRNIKSLELTDGGFYDNSGGYVARDIIAAMQHLLDTDPSFDSFKNSVFIHWIRFTDTPTRRLVTASEGGHHEFVTPIAAFDAVRQSRGVLSQSAPPKTGVSFIYLLDDWYQGTLNWLLSNKTKTAIEKRSSWLTGYENTECCLVTDAATNVTRRIPLTQEQMPELEKAGFKLDPLVPNAGQFNRIRRLVDKGAELPVDQPPTPAAQGSPAAAQGTAK
jgi:hypothetical protein